MKYILPALLLLLIVGCGPRKSANVHVLSLPETNQGRALPLHVIPVDDSLRTRLEVMSAEDWFLSDDVKTLSGIQKKVIRGAQNEVMRVERANNKNDFLVVVDFAEVEGSASQKLIIGDRYYKAKDIYVLVSRDHIRIITKKEYEDLKR
ncbi:MAG: hypothetical protein QNK37_18005 [Acidobacteriota bacterium]|nr:hypothetical protein [Acidobacteriota bacterium]